MRFRDRTDAGRQLAQQLQHYQGSDTIVLALPRGGVVVGYEVALALGAPLDVLVARKLGLPEDPELGIGAIAPGGIRVLDERFIGCLDLSAGELEQATQRETAEMHRRLARYRGARPPLELVGKTVILVDDGVATGLTARAAIQSIRQQMPQKLVLAVPVGAPDSIHTLRAEVDDLVCLLEPPQFSALSQFYLHFEQTSDEEVVSLLERARA